MKKIKDFFKTGVTIVIFTCVYYYYKVKNLFFRGPDDYRRGE